MKKALKKIGTFLLTVFACIVLIVAAVIYVLFIPFDIIRYHRTPYYRDLKIKYLCFKTSTDTVKLYNMIVRENLPIEYHRSGDFEYFIKNGVILFPDWLDDFGEKDGEWHFILYDDGDECYEPMQEIIDESMKSVKEEHKALPAKILMFCDKADTEAIENARACPYFEIILR